MRGKYKYTKSTILSLRVKRVIVLQAPLNNLSDCHVTLACHFPVRFNGELRAMEQTPGLVVLQT